MEEARPGGVFVWRWLEGFVLQVFAEGAVSDGDWNLLVADLGRNRARLSGVLVLTRGAAPSAAQRAELRAVLEQGAPVPAAVLTDSQLVRMALTALNYFLDKEGRPRPFAPDQIDDAFEYLRMPKALWPAGREALVDMQRGLGTNNEVRMP